MKDVPLLTVGQQEAYECFCFMTDRKEGGMLFLNASGGTGKTLLQPYFSKTPIRR